jgi:solute carrier family 25 (mitochondrial carrier protein), member 16
MAYHTRAAGSSLVKPSFLTTISTIYHESPQTIPGAAPSQSSPPSIFNRFPLLKFYRGFSATTIGMIPYAGMSFLTWDFLRAHYLPPPPSKPTPVADLVIGAISGALAQTVSYPFEIVRRRMQVGGLTRPDRLLRLGETVSTIWNAGGWRGFYVGLGIGYLKVIPMTSVSFAVWQGMKRVLEL